MKIKDLILCDNSGVARSKSQGKRGGMLLIVLIILAVTVILLSSALMVTVSSRDRYYVTAEKDQASLTAVSVAKALNEAIYYGKITDAEITSLVANGSTSSISGAIPGMADSTISNTTVTFSQKADAGRPDGYIFVDVATKIDAGVETGGTTETVRLVLKRIPPKNHGFQTLMTVYQNNNGVMNLGDGWFGDNAPDGALNLIVIKNKARAGSGSKAFVSDIVYMDMVEAQQNTIYEGNIVLYGDDAGFFAGGGGNASCTDEYILAIGSTVPAINPTASASGYTNTLEASIFRSGMSPTSNAAEFANGGYTYNGAFKAKGLYLFNTFLGFSDKWYDANMVDFDLGIVTEGKTLLYWNNTCNNNPIGLSVSSDSVFYKNPNAQFTSATSAFIDDIKAEAKKITDNHDIIMRSMSDGAATAMDDITLYGLLEDSAAVQAAYAGNTIPLLNTYFASGAPVTLTESAYIVDLTRNNVTVNRQIMFDLTNTNITLYFYGLHDLTFNENACFKFINGTMNFGRIISYDGAGIIIKPEYFGGDISKVNSSPTGIMATAGNLGLITSTPSGALEQIGSEYGYRIPYVPNPAQTTGGAPSWLYSYNVTRSGTVEGPIPHLYVYMFGDSDIDLGTGSVLQGYYGMFHTGSSLNNNGYPIIYARLEVADFTTAGGQTHLPYCPAPDAGGDGGEGSASIYKYYGIEKT